MPRFSQAQRRRWTLPLVVVFLLHWGFGIGSAAASVVCLEPDGKVTLELASSPCVKMGQSSSHPKTCVDLPNDDGHQDHEPSPNPDTKLPEASSLFLVTAFPLLLPLPMSMPADFQSILSPPANHHPAVLRETTVLRI
jgi:hypothetical protein